MLCHAGADLHLLVDGIRLDPAEREQGRYEFRFLAPVAALRVVSRFAIPRRMGLGDDDRCLGVYVTAVTVDQGGGAGRIELDSPEYLDGFHAVEEQSCRWTNGDAGLPAVLFGEDRREVVLTLTIRPLPRYGENGAAQADAKLFGAFDSLGANCAFGFAQRHFGAEPPGLMRWSGTSYDKVMRGLETRFAGLGDPALTELVWRDDTAEYRLSDDRYLSTHTFHGLRCADPGEELAIKQRGCSRLRLLGRKLVEDIARGERMLVFAATEPWVDAAALVRLAASLHRIGPATLLGVLVATEEDQVGQIEVAGSGLLLGHIDNLDWIGNSFGVWRTLCRTAYGMTRSG